MQPLLVALAHRLLLYIFHKPNKETSLQRLNMHIEIDLKFSRVNILFVDYKDNHSSRYTIPEISNTLAVEKSILESKPLPLIIWSLSLNLTGLLVKSHSLT